MSGDGNSVDAIIVQSIPDGSRSELTTGTAEQTCDTGTQRILKKALCHINGCIRNHRPLPIAGVGEGVLARVEPSVQ